MVLIWIKSMGEPSQEPGSMSNFQKPRTRLYQNISLERYILRMKIHPEMRPNLRENIRWGECWYAALVILHTICEMC